MQTPYFLISKELLDDNINAFQQALEAIWPNSKLSYSVKTNSLPWLLRYLHEKNILAEVVSDEEYLLAQKCGFADEQIVFNGPIKGRELFVEALKKGAFVNIDSKKECEFLQEAFEIYGDNVGIRINPDPDLFDKHDISYSEDGFRFGFSHETGELAAALRQIKEKTDSVGLHLHCNSVTRSKDVYIALAKYAAQIIQTYALSVSFIDVGGGFFGGIPGKPTAVEYLTEIKKQLESVVDISKTKLIIEPGSAIIGSAVDLVTSVIDVKDTKCARIVTTDASRIHIDPLWAKKNYLYSINAKKETVHNRQIVCGYTCMDHDRLMCIENQKELSEGDTITYHRVGAYSVTFGGMFICPLPAVYVKTAEGEIVPVRKPATVEQYMSLHG